MTTPKSRYIGKGLGEKLNDLSNELISKAEAIAEDIELFPEHFERELAKKYHEVSERQEHLEQARLKDVFSTLDLLKSEIETGNRKAMLELIQITADSLRLRTPPLQECRESLADCLDKIRNNLEVSKGFLPVKRGERSITSKREQMHREFFDAFAVEYLRRFENNSLEVAIFNVAERIEQTDSLIQKRWKRQHKAVSDSLEMAYTMLQARGIDMPILLKPKRKLNPKKVR